MKDTATQPANQNNNVMNETEKLTAEDVLDKHFPHSLYYPNGDRSKPMICDPSDCRRHSHEDEIIEAMEEHAQNQLDSYKDGLRKEFDGMENLKDYVYRPYDLTTYQKGLAISEFNRLKSLLDKPQD
jgi:hypothetical protein